MATPIETSSKSIASSPTITGTTLDSPGEKDLESGLERSISGSA